MNGGGQGRLVGKIDEKKKKGEGKEDNAIEVESYLLIMEFDSVEKKKIKREEGKDKKKGKGVQPEIIRKLSSFVPF